MEIAALTYGLLTSIVLSAAQRNRRLRQPHPPMLLHVGYLLCGLSAGLAIALSAFALSAVAFV